MSGKTARVIISGGGCWTRERRPTWGKVFDYTVLADVFCLSCDFAFPIRDLSFATFEIGKGVGLRLRVVKGVRVEGMRGREGVLCVVCSGWVGISRDVDVEGLVTCP